MKQVTLRIDEEFNEELFWQNDEARNLWDSIKDCGLYSIEMSKRQANQILEKFREIPGYYDDQNGNEPFIVVDED